MMTGASFVWSVENGTGSAVQDANGLLKGVKVGEVTVITTSQGVTQRNYITITPGEPVRVGLTPSSEDLYNLSSNEFL